MSVLSLVCQMVVVKGIIDIIVSMTSFQFDCFLKLCPFFALLLPVLNPERQLMMMNRNRRVRLISV